MNRLEIKISELDSQLSDARMYKDMYEQSQRENISEQKSFNDQLHAKESEIMELQNKIYRHEGTE